MCGVMLLMLFSMSVVQMSVSVVLISPILSVTLSTAALPSLNPSAAGLDIYTLAHTLKVKHEYFMKKKR